MSTAMCSESALQVGEVGSWCTYTCDRGSELVSGAEPTRFCQGDGTWSGDTVVCRRPECDAPAPADAAEVNDRRRVPANGMATCDGTRTGNSCRLSCGHGF